MKKMSAILVFGLAFSAAGESPSFADHTKHPEIAKAIQVQADAVRHDAKIYQRRRVSGEVWRIEDDVRILDKLVARHACLKADRAALQAATGQLRRASMGSDADVTIKAVNDIFAISTHISKTACGGNLE